MENVEFEIRNNTLSEMQIITHFKENGIFMSEQALLGYAQKVKSFAELTELWKEGKLIGLCACYMNNYDSLIAYITHIAISKESRHEGYGQLLIMNVEHCAKEKGFKAMELEVFKTNVIACDFYRKMGYAIKEDRGEKFLLCKSL